MALSAATVWEVRNVADFAGASDTNGGGWVVGASGTDYSFANINSDGSAKYALTNGQYVSGLTILTASASADMIGNIAYIAGGTGSIAGNWYQITGQSTGTSITVDRSTGLSVGTGITINIGGALGTPGVCTSVAGGIGGVFLAPQKAWLKYSATVYSLTTATPGPGGPVSLAGNAGPLEGYDAARGDRTGNRPRISWESVASPGSLTYLINGAGTTKYIVANIICDGNSVNNVGGFGSTSGRCTFADCIAINCSGTAAIGFSINGNTNAIRCQANTCLTGYSGGTGGGQTAECDAVTCTTGYSVMIASHCMARACGTGFQANLNIISSHCLADSCTTAGFAETAYGIFESCLATNCTGNGFTLTANNAMLMNCACYNNTTNVSVAPLWNEGPFASASVPYIASLGADPYVSQATADFRPNNNNPGGAQLRAAGIGVYGQTDNADIGAVQHTDPAGGGSGPLCGYMGMP